MHAVRPVHGPVRRVRTARVAGFALLALFLQTSAAWSKPEVVVPLAFGNQYKLELVKNGDDKNDHAAAVKGSIRVCGGHEYEFKYTAFPAPGWDVVEPEFDPKIGIWTKTVSLSPKEPEGKVKIGTVRFRNPKGEEADVKSDVVVTIKSLARDDYGDVDKAFTASVSQEEIEVKLRRIVGDVKIDRDAVLHLIEFSIMKAIAQLPDSKLIDVKAEAASLLETAIDYIGSKIDIYNQKADAAVKKAASDLKLAADYASPEVRLSGHYKYECGFRDPGDPGWKLNSPEILKIKALTGTGGIDIDIPVELAFKPLGVGAGIPINVEFHASVSADGTFTTTKVTGPDPANVPVTTAGVTPGMDVTLSGAISGGVGLIVNFGAGVTTTAEFRPLNVSLEAGKQKKEQ